MKSIICELILFYEKVIRFSYKILSVMHETTFEL